MLSHHPHKQMSGENFELSSVHIPNYIEQGDTAFLLVHHCVINCPIYGLLVLCILGFVLPVGDFAAV